MPVEFTLRLVELIVRLLYLKHKCLPLGQVIKPYEACLVSSVTRSMLGYDLNRKVLCRTCSRPRSPCLVKALRPWPGCYNAGIQRIFAGAWPNFLHGASVFENFSLNLKNFIFLEKSSPRCNHRNSTSRRLRPGRRFNLVDKICSGTSSRAVTSLSRAQALQKPGFIC